MLAAVIWFAYLAVRATFQFAISLDSNIAIAIIAACATVLVSVISIVLAKLMPFVILAVRHLNPD